MYENIPDLLTRKEAQRILCVGKNTLLNLIHTQKLPAIIIGGSFKIRKDDLIEFIDNSIYWHKYE